MTEQISTPAPADASRGDRSARIAPRLAYLAVGGAVGAAVALLFAPKPGRELRTDIADATRKGVDRTREAAHTLGERAGEYYEVSRERAAEVLASVGQRRGGVRLSDYDEDLFIG